MSNNKNIKFSIVTATYRKLDGSTYAHLKNTLTSLKNQTYDNYKLFLIGDNYIDNEELLELSKIIPKEKIYVKNLPTAVEREQYSGRDLWCYGGQNANITGIKQALKEGGDYLCQLDHDDMFFPDHLETIYDCIQKTKTNFIATKCGSYPNIPPIGLYTKYRPVSSRLFKVSVCLNQKYYCILPRSIPEMKERYGRIYACDADLWNQINEFMEKRNEHGVFIDKITCRKIGGKYPINQPEIVK